MAEDLRPNLRIRVGDYDLMYAVIFNEAEAWACSNREGDRWEEFNVADAICKCHLSSRETWLRMWPNLPPLPRGAFGLM